MKKKWKGVWLSQVRLVDGEGVNQPVQDPEIGV